MSWEMGQGSDEDMGDFRKDRSTLFCILLLMIQNEFIIPAPCDPLTL